MKKLICMLLAVVLTLGCLAGVCFAIDPVFEVTNGTTVTNAYSPKELSALISEDGTTVIKLMQDYTYTGDTYMINESPSLTFDLNGHTLTAKKEGAGFIYVKTVGTKNGITTVKNGTVITNVKNVRLDKGGLTMQDVKGFAFNSYNISYADKTATYNDGNLITGCYLVAANHSPIAYGTAQTKTADHSKVNVKIEKSTIICAKTPGTSVLRRNSNVVIGGSFELGDDVDMYTRNSQGLGFYFEDHCVVFGKEVVQGKNNNTMTFPELDGHKVEAMFKYSTGPAGSGNYTERPKEDPVSKDPFAVVINGTTETPITLSDLSKLKSLVNKDGSTTIKMTSDITYNGSDYMFNELPSFTFDMNGYTLKAPKGGVVYVKTAGTKNGVTTIKNGVIISSNKNARIDKGGLRMENIVGYNIKAYNISLAEKSNKYNKDNLITGCYLLCSNSSVFGWGTALSTNSSIADHSPVSIKIENTVMGQVKTPGTTVIRVNSDKVVAGTIELGKSVTFLTRNQQNGGYANPASVYFSGETLTMTGKSTEDMIIPQMDNLEVLAMCKWETPKGEFATTPAPAKVKVPDFADVAKDFWGYEAIMNAAGEGLVKGKSQNADGTMNFVPNASMTRAEFITVICRYFFPADAAIVTSGSGKWWIGYYDLALEKEFLGASELDGGDLDKTITREEMALVLSRTAPAQAAFASVTPAAETAIPDAASVSAEYKEAVLWAYGAGLLKGVDDKGTFNPQGELNRASVATIFNTLLNNK